MAAVERPVEETIRELELAHSTGQMLCECNDAGCTRLLQLEPGEYEALRSDTTLFAVLPGHERSSGEQLLIKTERFVVVRRRWIVRPSPLRARPGTMA